VPNEKPDSFQCGPFEVSRNADVRQFVDKLNRLREAVDACRVQPGVGYNVSRSANGTVLSIRSAAASAPAAAERFPFQVTRAARDGAPGFVVEQQSRLNAARIPGAGEFQPAPARASSYNVFLEAQVGQNLSVLRPVFAAYRETEVKEVVEPQPYSGPQNLTRMLIASVSPSGVVQAVRTHVTSILVSYAGQPAVIMTSQP
jgi:hypothetical protein